jgi:hypothetical protein
VDLGCCVPRGDAWAEAAVPQRWLAFSDLHVSHRTLGTCLQVLESVHEEAARRGAGILFLGGADGGSVVWDALLPSAFSAEQHSLPHVACN